MMNLLMMLQHQVLNKKSDHEAVKDFLLDVSSRCDKELRDEITAVDVSTGKMSLHYALELGDVSLVRTLLGYGAPSDVRDYGGRLPEDCLPKSSCRVEQKILLRGEKLKAYFESVDNAVHHLIQVSDIAMSASYECVEKLDTPAMIMVGVSADNKASWLDQMFLESVPDVVAQCMFEGDEDESIQKLAVPRQYELDGSHVSWVDVPIQGDKKDLTEMLSVSVSKQAIRQQYKSFVGLTMVCSESAIVSRSISELCGLLERTGEFLIERPLGVVPVLLSLPFDMGDEALSSLCHKLQRLRDYYVLKDYVDENDRAIYTVLRSLFSDMNDASSLRMDNIVLSRSGLLGRVAKMHVQYGTDQFNETIDSSVLDMFCRQIKTVLDYEKALMSNVLEMQANLRSHGVHHGCPANVDAHHCSSLDVRYVALESQIIWSKLCVLLNEFSDQRTQMIVSIKRALRRIDVFETNLHIGQASSWSSSLIEKKVCVGLLNMLHRILNTVEMQKVVSNKTIVHDLCASSC